jgi:hypothetical protein
MSEIQKFVAQAPLGSVVESLGIAISNAQFAMDRNSLAILQMMAAEQVSITSGAKTVQTSLLSLGFAPTFYHITEASVEARLAFSMTQEQDISASVSARYGGGLSMVAASVNASYTNKYSFHAEGSSTVSAKFVSLPPPAELKEILAAMRK